MGVIAAGLFHVTWWAAVAGACVLGLISLTSAFGSFARYGQAESAIGLPVILLSSTLNAGAAAAASFALGRAIGWCWGI
jgi:hypothetical protein